jgi:hypothetical protein
VRILVGVVLACACAAGCKKETAPSGTPAQSAATQAAAKGARGDKPKAQDNAPIELDAVVDGKALHWTRAELAKIPAISVSGDSGDGQRAAWSLRDIVKTLVGPTARAVELKGEAGGSLKVEAALWQDGTKQPVLRQNRRGILKFYWVDQAGRPIEGDGLRGVREVDIQK